MATDTLQRKPAEIATVYAQYLKQFLKRADVQNGTRVSYHDNQDPDGSLKPENWVNLGDARVTTGFCVSFSNAILKDKLFQTLIASRGAQAKLVSIDIKEQYYGHCKPSFVANKWHTALLVRDNNINFILDPTCAQFGNQFVGKFVWDLNTWLQTFQAANDTHHITGFTNDVLDYLPCTVTTGNYDQAMVLTINALHNIPTLVDTERKMFADFLLKGINLLNRKIELGNLTDKDFQYMDNISRISKQLSFANYPNNCGKEQYYVMKFDDKESAKKWLTKYVSIYKHILPYYLITSASLNDACYFAGISPENINIESTKPETYIVLNFKSSQGLMLDNILEHTSLFIPYGIKAEMKNIYNSGEMFPESSYGVKKTTNTIIAEIKMF